MKSPRPAPLLPVGLCFAAGCLTGLETADYFSFWLGGALGIAVAWLALLGRREKWSYAALLAALFFAGAFHGSLREGWAPPGDLRLLPDTKFDSLTQWHGVVEGDPRFRPRTEKSDTGRTLLTLQLDGWRSRDEAAAESAWHPARGQMQVRVDNVTAEAFHYGDVLQVAGSLQFPQPPSNPGQFDVPAYLARQDIFYEVQADTGAVVKLGAGGGSPVMHAAWQARDWALEKLRLGIEDDPVVSSLLGGMLLGYVQQVPGEIETAFRNTGTYHVFAVSGQNVAEILAVGLVAMSLGGFVRWRWGWLMVPVLVFYCLITGGQPSAVRALLMAILVLAAWWCERPVSALNLWAVALIAVMVSDPKLVSNLSFQLSFAVVAALIWLTPPLHRWLCALIALDDDLDLIPNELIPPWRRQWQTGVRWMLLLVASSVAAWLGSVPLMVWYFHQLAPIGLVANLVVVPLAGEIVVLGTLALSLAPVSTALVATMNNANWLLVKGLVWCVTIFSQVPGGCFYVPDVRVSWHPAEPEFVCLQTGGTTSLLIRYEGKAWLVNTGTDGQFRYVTNSARKFYGVNRLEAVFLTELSGPQAGGALSLLQEKAVSRWIVPPSEKLSKAVQPWRIAADSARISRETWRSGTVETLGPGFTVTALTAEGDVDGALRAEDRAMVLLFGYKDSKSGWEKTLLYAGRVGAQVEESLLRQRPGLHADVLVQGAHSTQPNLSTRWLQAIRPEEVIIAAPGSYSESRFDSIDLLPDTQRPRAWRQEKTGAVVVRLKGNGVEVFPAVR